MKIAAYNIQSGGFANYQSVADRPENLGLLQEAVAEIGADFVGLVDTFRWKDIFSDSDLQQLFGYKYSYHIGMDDVRVDKRIGLAVLSNFPIKRAQALRLATRNCLYTRVELPGKVLDVFTVYLDDKSEDTRLEQVRTLIQATPGERVLVIGDLNCIYKSDGPKLWADFEEFVRENPKFKERGDYESYFVPGIKDAMRGEVIELIRAAGFKDADSGPRQPTAFTRIHASGIPTIFRVDHMFGTKDLRVKNFQVLTDAIFETASDHFPVVCEIV